MSSSRDRLKAAPGPRARRPAARNRGPGERAGLAPVAVLSAAHELARREGIPALSMRRLAERLGVAPNALYSHFPDKAALMDALLDHLLGEVTAPATVPGSKTWQDGLAEILRQTRRVLLVHPELIPLYLARPGRGPNATRLGEAMLALLAGGGVTGRAAAEALRVLLIFTLGFAAHEAPRRADPAGQARIRESASAFRRDPRQRHLHGLADELAQHADDHTFETGLGWLLAGITREAQADSLASPSRR